jgi:hypothetical protein
LRNGRNPSAQSRAISGNVQLPRSAIIGAFAGHFGKRTVAKERNYRNHDVYTKLFKGLQQELNPLQLRASARVSAISHGEQGAAQRQTVCTLNTSLLFFGF